MDERWANIDLAFRNGLKDYEALPPHDAWDTISTRIRKKNASFNYMKVAAVMAMAIVTSLLAYKWTANNIGTVETSMVALSEKSSAPSDFKIEQAPITQKRRINNPARLTTQVAEENNTENFTKTTDYTNLYRIPTLLGTNAIIPENKYPLDISKHNASGNASPDPLFTVDDLNSEYQEYLNQAVLEKNAPKWSVAALASPTYYGKINAGSDELSKQIMASEKPVMSYSGGITLAYKVNRRFSIQSGLFYSSVGQELDGIYSFAGFQKYDYSKGDHNFEVLTTNGTVYTNNADVYLYADGNSQRLISNYNNDIFDPKKASLDYIDNTLRQSMSYLELPVFLRYKVIDKTLGLNVIGGVSYNMLLDNSVYAEIDGNRYMVGTTEGLNMFSISSSLGMGMEYKFSSKLSLNLEPTFRYYMNTFNNNAGSHFHPYSFGIFSGLSYKF